MTVPKVQYKTRGVKMDCFFLARRPFLQFNGVSMRLATTWNVDKDESSEKTEELASK